MLMQDVLDLARLDLNDDDKTRHTDGDLLNYANDSIQQMVMSRPDLFIGLFYQLPSSELLTTDTFPLPDTKKRAVADYIVGRASMINTEESSVTKAGAYLSLAQKEAGIN